MGVTTGISWTDATWNPIRGCSRVSEGCRHCYAESVAYRFSGPGLPYEGLVQLEVESRGPIVDTYRRLPKWNGKIKFVEEHLLDPLRWKKPRRIFVNSMSDLFHENVTDEMRDRIFAVMATATHQEFQILTKRAKQTLEYLRECGRKILIQRAVDAMMPRGKMPKGLHAATDGTVVPHTRWPLPNVRIGVSVENQKAADDRIDYLCELAADDWNTMVSFEPLLSAVDPGSWWLSFGAKTWAIVGGESGAGARPMHPDWARSLRDQCKAAGVPYFFKQWGEWTPVPRQWADEPLSPIMVARGDIFLTHGGEFDVLGVDLGSRYEATGIPMRHIGTKASGWLLDGVEHHEFPAVSA